MKNEQHPVWNEEYIQRQGVIVTEVTNMPTGELPFQTDMLVIGLCLQGSSTFDYNMNTRTFVPHDIGVALPNSLFTHSFASPDYRAVMVFISKAFFDELIIRSSFMDYKKYYYSPNYHLSDEQFEDIQAVLHVLHMVSESDHAKRKESQENILDLLFYTLTQYRGKEDPKSKTKTRNEQLFSRFHDLLTLHYAEHHDIAWYAQQLSLTPKYFSVLIRQATGKSTAEWIDIELVMHAKRLLRTSGNLTIQQIAYALGFNENASFCRFFKNNTNLRPSEYREG